MAYIPPEGDNVVLDLTGTYSPPDGDTIVLDLQSNPFIADNLEVEWDTDLWDPAPTSVFLTTPRFRATFRDLSALSGIAATGVEIVVTDLSDLTIVWASGLMDFAAMDAAGHPILDPGVHYLYPDEICAVRYNHNGTAVSPGVLLRDAESYSIVFKYWVGVLPSATAVTSFTMASAIAAIDPEMTITYVIGSELDPPPGHMIDGTWSAVSPLANVRPMKPWFRAKYYSSIAAVSGAPDEYLVTGVWVQVRYAAPPYNVVWDSGVLDFTDWDNPPYDKPILPDHGHVLRSGETCEIVYQHDAVSGLMSLPRDGNSYTWRMLFFCKHEGIYSEWSPDFEFSQFEETWEATSLLCEGLTNPIGVTDLNPEFDATFLASYTEFYTPKIISYQLQVSDVVNFATVRWDTGEIFEAHTPDPYASLLTIEYPLTDLRRTGLTLYWRVKLKIDTEWLPFGMELDWFAVQNWTFFEEIWSASNIRTNGLTTPTALKDYYPEFTAQFNNNYAPARATDVQFQVINTVPSEYYIRCANYDSTDIVTIGNVAPLRIIGDLTLEFWIRPTNISYNRQNIIDKCYGGEYTLTLETNGSLNYFHGTSGSEAAPYIARLWNLGLVNGTWYHIAIVRNYTTHSVRCYVATGHGTHVDWGEGAGAAWINPVVSTGLVRLGRGYTGFSYNGDLVEVRFWNTVRTIAQLNTYYRLRLLGSETGLVGYYKLEETTGNAIDSSLSECHGIVTGVSRLLSTLLFINPLGSSTVKWDSGWIELTPHLEPGQSCPTVYYPQPYPDDDEGFYYDQTQFIIQARYKLITEYEDITSYAVDHFTMGKANVSALYPRVDYVHGTLRVRGPFPGFDAQYDSDAYNALYPVEDPREYVTFVHIQVSTSSTVWTSLVWETTGDGYWAELDPHFLSIPLTYSDMKRMGNGEPPYLLAYDTVYYWRIQFKNERGVEGDWSEVMQFTYVGTVLSVVSDTDIINCFYRNEIDDLEEWEMYAETISGSIFFTLKNITTGSVAVNGYNLNVGYQPRLFFDGDETSSTYGQITMLFLVNGKIFKRDWMITNYTPGTAPAIAPQLLDGAIDVTRTLPNKIDIMDEAQRPFKPTSVSIYPGSICNEFGQLNPGDFDYVVEFTVPSNHTYFENSKTYKIYIRNGIFDAAYTDPLAGYLPATDLGCDITNTQESKLAPWLPDMVNEFVETTPVHATFKPGIKMVVSRQTFGELQSLMGCVTSDGAAPYWTISTMLYKKSIYAPEENYFGVMGCVVPYGCAPYWTISTMLYKKSIYAPEESFGAMGDRSIEGIEGTSEWSNSDFYGGQYWLTYNYYSERVR